MAKSDQDPEPHGSAFVNRTLLDSLSALRSCPCGKRGRSALLCSSVLRKNFLFSPMSSTCAVFNILNLIWRWAWAVPRLPLPPRPTYTYRRSRQFSLLRYLLLIPGKATYCFLCISVSNPDPHDSALICSLESRSVMGMRIGKGKRKGARKFKYINQISSPLTGSFTYVGMF